MSDVNLATSLGKKGGGDGVFREFVETILGEEIIIGKNILGQEYGRVGTSRIEVQDLDTLTDWQLMEMKYRALSFNLGTVR